MEHYFNGLKNYAVFSGKASRPEFWYFILFNFIITFILGLIDSFIGIEIIPGRGILSTIYFLLVITPIIALSVRRLHDVGKSGYTILFNGTMILGPLLVVLGINSLFLSAVLSFSGPIYLLSLYIKKGI
ncbi:MAG: DUF805 domain-containing protein [Candidatus Paceibacterota bacterium]